MIELLQRLFSGNCLVCKRNDIDSVCGQCFTQLPFATSGCKICSSNHTMSATHICADCQKKPPPFDEIIPLFYYQPPINQLIARMKFSFDPQLANLMGGWLARHLQNTESFTAPECVIPVPLHRRRRAVRGYNQALEIARPIAKQLQIPLYQQYCRRKRHTKAQAELPQTKRLKNMHKSFQINTKNIPQSLAIVDDVVTTGATVRELASTWKKAGTKKISVWCIARSAGRT